jgi:putative ABC transport system substrate-binding protein
MNRRDWVIAFLTAGIAHNVAIAQSQKVSWRIGFLSPNSAADAGPYLDQFREGMREANYTEGQHYSVEGRSAEGMRERLDALAAELVRLNVDVIVAVTTSAVAAARKATATIPIVFVSVGDPVATGFADSLAHPGRNMTGMANFSVDLAPKLLELLKLAVPRASSIAWLGNINNPLNAPATAQMQAAANAVGVRLMLTHWNDTNDINVAMSEAARGGAQAIVVSGDPYLFEHRKEISDMAIKHRLALISPYREYTETGSLMSYGINVKAQLRQAATFVVKIMRGARPGDLPVEQPTTLELVLNAKTAKALGIRIPQSLLVRADRVID